MSARRNPREPRRRRDLFFWGVAAGSAFLLYQLVTTVIEELPRLLRGLK